METDDSNTSLKFESSVFYTQFRNKIQSVCSLCMECDGLKCSTPVRGLKCDLAINNSTSTVKITGVGHRIWRENFFSKLAKTLFMQYVKETDSQVNDIHVKECTHATRPKVSEKCISLNAKSYRDHMQRFPAGVFFIKGSWCSSHLYQCTNSQQTGLIKRAASIWNYQATGPYGIRASRV